jgi:ABC-type glycerol-3-phosphate transport system permease component
MLDMIPWFATMVGAYIVFRCFEITADEEAKSGRLFDVLAVVVVLTAVASGVRIWMIKQETERKIESTREMMDTGDTEGSSTDDDLDEEISY